MLRIHNISYQYPKSETFTLKNVSFCLTAGENLSIIGESGCGKSTLLKAVYGLLDLDKGQITFDDKPVLGPAFHLVPGIPDMKYLAQDFELMPFIKVKENVGKYLSNVFFEEKVKRTAELLALVGLSEFSETMTNRLSGGQKQRVALAQVLAQEPKLLLLDEPFSHIDHFRKNSFRREFFGYLKEKNIACIVATHDMADVLPFADKVLVIKAGQIIQEGQTKTVYQQPKNLEIAKLFGDAFEVSNQTLDDLSIKNNGQILYPHQLKISQNDGILVKIEKKYFHGSHYLYEVTYNNDKLMFESTENIDIGKMVKLNQTFL